MFDYSEIKNQLTDYITNGDAYIEDYDVDAIMDELRDMDVQSIGDVDIDELLSVYDVNGTGDIETAYGEFLDLDPETGDWCILVQDATTSRIYLHIGEVGRAEAVRAALRWYATGDTGIRRVEYTVEWGVEGSGWTDGESFGTLDDAMECYRAQCGEEPDQSRFRTVTLRKVERWYEDGDIMQETVLDTIEEARF